MVFDGGGAIIGGVVVGGVAGGGAVTLVGEGGTTGGTAGGSAEPAGVGVWQRVGLTAKAATRTKTSACKEVEGLQQLPCILRYLQIWLGQKHPLRPC